MNLNDTLGFKKADIWPDHGIKRAYLYRGSASTPARRAKKMKDCETEFSQYNKICAEQTGKSAWLKM